MEIENDRSGRQPGAQAGNQAGSWASPKESLEWETSMGRRTESDDSRNTAVSLEASVSGLTPTPRRKKLR